MCFFLPLTPALKLKLRFLGLPEGWRVVWGRGVASKVGDDDDDGDDADGQLVLHSSWFCIAVLLHRSASLGDRSP